MAHLIKLEANKTYATEKNAIAAVEKKFSHINTRYFIMKTEDNRYFPVFIGQDALQNMVHFHFNVVA